MTDQSLLHFRICCCANSFTPGFSLVNKPAFIDLDVVRRYFPVMRTIVLTKGQIILPAEIRREDDIKAGQEFEIERIDRGEYLLKRKTKLRNKGLVKLLLSCPVKDWFQPLDRTETTDDIRLPKLG